MGFDFDKLKDKVSDLAQTGVAKAKELADVAVDKGKELGEIGKLKVSNASEQENIKKAYLELGRLYFAEKGDAPDPAYADLCQKVRDAQAKIEYNNQRIADIKTASGADEEVDVIIDCDCTVADAPAGESADTCDGCAVNEDDTPIQ